ncbi:MAG TPA: ATP-binding protein [Acidimicrobiales bacterium]|nr:ATP-binding protein [Acidimicrobiales bacterium]
MPHDAVGVVFPPEPTSVREARAWLREVMAGRDDDVVETAVLLSSELVTNAVLHARTPVELRAWHEGVTTHVEVADASQAMPVRKQFGAEAATGRGLHLLSSLASAWGVEADASGKRIWFEVADPGADDSPDAVAAPVVALRPTVTAAPEVTALVADGAGGGPAPAPPAVLAAAPAVAPVGPPADEPINFRILGLPVAEYLAVEAHNDALVREFSLISGAPAAPDLAAMAQEFAARFGTATTVVRDQVQAAVDAGRRWVDLVLPVPRAAVPWLLDLARRLDAADRMAEQGRLLTLGGSARVRRFRDWYTGQLQAQAAGEPATPWPWPDEPTAAG